MCKLESGTNPPSVDTLCKIADYYGVSIDYLLGREDYSDYVWSLSTGYSITPEKAKGILLGDSNEDFNEALKKFNTEYSAECQKEVVLVSLEKLQKNCNYLNFDDLKHAIGILLEMCSDPSKFDTLNSLNQIINNVEHFAYLLTILPKIPTESVIYLEKFIDSIINK
jgi:transcriptional regulator with XRE-family HTH domain